MTQAEKILWRQLNNNKLGVRFKAQHPIHIFIADFYCHTHKLVIELDETIHNLQVDYNKVRTAEMERYGIKVIRFTNEEVLNNIESVITKIKEVLDKKATPVTKTFNGGFDASHQKPPFWWFGIIWKGINRRKAIVN